MRHTPPSLREGFEKVKRPPHLDGDPMCGRYHLNRAQRRVAEHFEVEGWSESKIPLRLPCFNVAPTRTTPALRLDTTGGGHSPANDGALCDAVRDGWGNRRERDERPGRTGGGA